MIANENAEATEDESATEDNYTDSAVDDKGKDSAPENEAKDDTKPIASGDADDATEGDSTNKPYWPEDWREKAAAHAGADDPKAVKRELKRLERIADPSAIYGMYRELESKFTSGNLIKKPGKDASEEDVKAFRKQMGVPDDMDEYLTGYEPPAGAEISESDTEVVSNLVGALFEAGAPTETVHAMMDWYFNVQEQTVSNTQEADDQYRYDSERELKEEYGPAYKRTINGIAQLFSTAPGGADIENENSVMSRLMGGRTRDGRIIGNDPDVVRWLATLNAEVNPMSTVIDTTGANGRGVDDRLKEIDNLRRTDKKAYFRDSALQEEERRLLDAKARASARA